MAICTIDDCDRPAAKRTWCEMHYQRWKRTGDPTKTRTTWSRHKGTPEERFLAKILKPDGENGCWRFDGFHMKNGYARFGVAVGVSALAHRFSYELAHGVTLPPKASGMELDHLCRNRWCVNPAHLELVTKAENIRRGEAGVLRQPKTHCPHGHPYDESNTHIWNGRRFCKECGRLANRRYREKQRGLRGHRNDPDDRNGPAVPGSDPPADPR